MELRHLQVPISTSKTSLSENNRDQDRVPNNKVMAEPNVIIDAAEVSYSTLVITRGSQNDWEIRKRCLVVVGFTNPPVFREVLRKLERSEICTSGEWW